MPDTSLFKKLRLQPGQNMLLLNATPEWQFFFAANHTVYIIPEGKATLVILFAPDRASLEKHIAQAKSVITPDGIVWVAYPKGRSGIQTDLTRDRGWESMPQTVWQPLSLISLDEKWSAFSFRLAGDMPVKGRRMMRHDPTTTKPKEENPYIDNVNRIIKLPEDLGQALAENRNALVFFETLSFTNRKEYVTWVIAAKREETREKRVLETVNKLSQGLKNPMDKGK